MSKKGFLLVGTIFCVVLLLTGKIATFAQTTCSNSFYTINPPSGQTFTSSCISGNAILYDNDSRYLFFQPSAEVTGIPFIKTLNSEIKSLPLSWSVQVTQPTTVYLFYRHIPGQTAPDWITQQYTRRTTDDLSNINQYLLRKNEEGLIGLYDIYTKTISPGTVNFSGASDAQHLAYSMYIVALKPATSPTATPVITPQPTQAPIPSVTPRPTASGNSPSGEAMPVGDLPGWKQIFTDDFTTNVTVGNFPGTAYKSKWDVYLDGWPDSAGKRGQPSRYYPSKVISVSNGVLNKYLHSENGISMGAAILPILPGHTSSRNGQRYGKYTVRFKSQPIRGYKTAWLQWPDSGVWPRDGEIDFPEGNLDGTIKAYMHRQNGTFGGDQDAYSTTALYTSWHTASLEWGPSQLRFILDGNVVGTSTSRIPNTSMHWVLQTESCYSVCPAPGATANLQIDWVAVYSRL